MRSPRGPEVIFCSFGDMLRVPGSRGDLLQLKSQGRDVRVVYSPLDAVNLAAANPDRKVVFFAIGFETTAPANAMAVWHGAQAGLDELQRAGVARAGAAGDDAPSSKSPDNRVQGFLGPGHVCTVMGYDEYEPIAAEYRRADRRSRFRAARPARRHPARTVRQLEAGRAEVENPYARAVRAEGNPASRRLIEDVFEVCDRKWRGIGTIPASGYRLRAEYRDHDAERLFEVERHRDPGIVGLHQRADLQGTQEAARLPGVRLRVHAADAAGGDDGVVRRGLRGLLRLRPASRGAGHELTQDEEPRLMSSFGGETAVQDHRGRRARRSGPSPSAPARCRGRSTTTSCSGHGGGGLLTAELIQRLFVPAFGNDVLAALEDQATVRLGRRQRRRRRPAGLHDRFVRRPAAVLPRRRHRQAGGARHGQRPGGRRRRAAVPGGGVHPRRGAGARRPASGSSLRCARPATRPG